MKHAVEMCSVAMLYSYIPSFVKIGSGIQKLIGVTQTGRRSRKTTLIFFSK
jgi:hypothetical protein